MPVSLVVIHVESGTESGTCSWFQNPNAHVSAHYSISKSGTIYQHVPEDCVAWHAGLPAPCVWNMQNKNPKPGVSPNTYSIGIEHEGFDDGEPWPEDQVRASKELVADICKRHGIPCDEAHVVPHHWITNLHTCPGSACPLPKIISPLSTN